MNEKARGRIKPSERIAQIAMERYSTVTSPSGDPRVREESRECDERDPRAIVDFLDVIIPAPEDAVRVVTEGEAHGRRSEVSCFDDYPFDYDVFIASVAETVLASLVKPTNDHPIDAKDAARAAVQYADALWVELEVRRAKKETR